MKEVYRQYTEEFPEELERLRAVMRRSESIEQARQERIKKKLALIQKCREEIANETRNKRS